MTTQSKMEAYKGSKGKKQVQAQKISASTKKRQYRIHQNEANESLEFFMRLLGIRCRADYRDGVKRAQSKNP